MTRIDRLSDLPEHLRAQAIPHQRARPVQHEARLQAAIVGQARELAPLIPALWWLIHVPNGGKRSIQTARMLAAMGVTSGVPDLLLFWRVGPWSGLALEVKYGRTTTTDDQQAWLTHLCSQGWVCAVVTDADTAVARILDYLEGRYPDDTTNALDPASAP